MGAFLGFRYPLRWLKKASVRLSAFGGKLVPQSLRGRIALLVVVTICVPVFIIGYIADVQGRSAILHEKSEKLYGIAKLLDNKLRSAFPRFGDDERLGREERIATLHARVTPFAEEVAKVYPGLAVGYYHRGLDAIITYAPNSEYSYTVGTPISADHLGRQVLATGEPMVAFGSQVRGNIMNAMWPIVRDGEVIGYIWANELLDNVQLQMRKLDWSIFWVTIWVLIVSLALVAVVTRSFARNVNVVTNGLRRLKYDLTATLPPLTGEIGEIARSANDMARALREARGLSENILDSISDGVITVDNDGIVTSLNPAAQRIVDLDPKTTLNRPYKDAIADIPNFDSPLLSTLMTQKPLVGVEIEYPVRGAIRHLSTSSSLIRTGDGDSIGVVSFIRDMTEKKEMQRHVEHAEKFASLGELVAGVAHEVRNPLTAIRGFVQYLKEGATIEEREEYTEIILKEVDAINRVIKQLLSFARPAPQYYRLTKVEDLVRDALRLIKTRSVSGRIDFKLAIAEGLPEIEVDGELIKQVLLNLLLNAVQAIDNRGTVTVSARRPSSEIVEIDVADDGAGIDEQNLKNLFSPFFTTKPTGTGLGLSIVQRVVLAHDGDVDIKSAVGKGTAVMLRFPIRRAEKGAL